MGMPLTEHRFTADEYHRMGDAGILHEDDRVELIHGQVVEMSPIGPGHSGCVSALTTRLAQRVGDAALVSVQNPLDLGEYDEPRPDLALLRLQPGEYRRAHPRAPDVLLVLEVADTSLRYDRGTKLPLYAGAGIPEAWLVNLPADAVEVYREPRDGRYGDVRTARRGETIAPLAFPDLTLAVDEILG